MSGVMRFFLGVGCFLLGALYVQKFPEARTAPGPVLSVITSLIQGGMWAFWITAFTKKVKWISIASGVATFFLFAQGMATWIPLHILKPLEDGSLSGTFKSVLIGLLMLTATLVLPIKVGQAIQRAQLINILEWPVLLLIRIRSLLSGWTFEKPTSQSEDIRMADKNTKNTKANQEKLSKITQEIKTKQDLLQKSKNQNDPIMQSAIELWKYVRDDLRYTNFWDQLVRRLEEGDKKKTLQKIRERVEQETKLNQEIAALREAELNLYNTLHSTKIEATKLDLRSERFSKERIKEQIKIDLDIEDKRLKLQNLEKEMGIEQKQTQLNKLKAAPEQRDRVKDEMEAIKKEIQAEQDLRNLLKGAGYPEDDIEAIVRDFRQKAFERKII